MEPLRVPPYAVPAHDDTVTGRAERIAVPPHDDTVAGRAERIAVPPCTRADYYTTRSVESDQWNPHFVSLTKFNAAVSRKLGLPG